jgi:uncharacterized protein YxjI
MRTNATPDQLREALSEVNTRFGYEIKFNRFETIKKWTFFTLKTKSGVPGSRFSSSGRKGPWVSWHAHGHLFDEVFRLNPKSVIWSGGRKITALEGNWEDKNVGSMMSPIMFSETSIL